LVRENVGTDPNVPQNPRREKVELRAGRAQPRIPSPEHDARDSYQQDRARALGAWLQRDIQRGPVESGPPGPFARLVDREHLGVRSRIRALHHPIATAAEHFTAGDHDGPHGNLSGRARFGREPDGFLHPGLVVGRFADVEPPETYP